MVTSRWILLRMKNIPEKVIEKITTHILCSSTLFQKSCLYEIVWKNMVETNKVNR